MELAVVEELQNILENRVFQDNHMLRERFKEGDKASFRIKPSVRAKLCRWLVIIHKSQKLNLFVEWIQTLDDARYSEFVVALGAIESSDDQVNDTQVEDSFVGIFGSYTFFFFFDSAHEILSFLILTCHDVRYTQIGENDCSAIQKLVYSVLVSIIDCTYILDILLHKRLIEGSRLLVFVLLHEERMRDV
jgi:hypothetical protein